MTMMKMVMSIFQTTEYPYTLVSIFLHKGVGREREKREESVSGQLHVMAFECTLVCLFAWLVGWLFGWLSSVLLLANTSRN